MRTRTIEKITIVATQWKQAVTNIGWILVGFATASALFNPSYVTHALLDIAGAMVILAARILR